MENDGISGGRSTADGDTPSWVGRTLAGRYRLDRVLGRGGMAVAYLARDLRLDRTVVVKVPHAHVLAEEGFAERFAREIQSLTALPHPHVVKAFDAGREDDVPYAVLEHLVGGSLKDRLAAHGRQAPVEVLRWLPGIAAALDFVHRHGVVHRDVKPGNILFDGEGHAFLSDFGIAKALQSVETGLTGTGVTPGSPNYMAPEVAIGGSAIYAAYDQYALAVVVYEALSGALPHPSHGSPAQVIYRIASTPIVRLDAVASDVPSGCVVAVHRALSREAYDRFACCEDFVDAFRAGVAGRVQPAASAPPPIPPTAARAAPPASAPAVPAPVAPSAAPTRVVPTAIPPPLESPRSPSVTSTPAPTPPPLPRPAPPAEPAESPPTSPTLRAPPPRRTPIAESTGRLPRRAPDASRRAPTAPVREEDAPRSRRRGVWVGVGVGLGLVALAIVLFARGPSGGSTPPPPPPPLSLADPAEGTLLASRAFDVRGRAALHHRSVEVNGVSASRAGVDFTARVTAPDDGPFEILVAADGPDGPERLRRAVEVDATAPDVRLDEPTADGATVRTSALHLRGRVVEAHLLALELDGVRVAVADDGTFDVAVDLEPRVDRTVRLVARDRAGHESTPLVRTVRYEPGPPAWEAPLAQARTAAGAGDWARASRALRAAREVGPPPPSALPAGLAEGVARYDAPPALDVLEPREGAAVSERTVTVRGSLRSGRPSDRVEVDGRPVDLDGDRFEATVLLPGTGATTIRVRVVDGDEERAVEQRRVTYEPPRWTAFLAGWAEPVGAARDAATGFPTRVRRGVDGGEMALVPGGAFEMGAVPGDAAARDDERPRRRVDVGPAYYVDVTEVTVAQWKRYVAAGGGRMAVLAAGTTDASPAHGMTFDDARGFAAWAGGALPSEAQWERAARGGRDDAIYPWGDTDASGSRNGAGTADGFAKLAPVRTFAANGFGLFDMAGNVREWCSDANGTAGGRILRGGSWDAAPAALRASAREVGIGAARYDTVGLRVVRPLP